LELSIIIVNYNTFSLTCACVHSLYRHINDVDFEIILVDNASRDVNPREFLAAFPDIKLVVNDKNLGFAGGNNSGLPFATGDFVLLLNSDTELLEPGIKKCIDYLKENEKVGALSCKLLFPSGQVQHCANDFPSIRNELVELFRLNKLFASAFDLNGFYFNHLTLKKVDWVWGTFFLMPHSLLDIFPNRKLPDDFFMYYEDAQWCYLIRKAGYEIFYFPDYEVLHHLSASSSESAIARLKMEAVIKNERQFLLKEKSKTYLNLLYLLRALKYFSLRRSEFRSLAVTYLKNLFR